MALDPQLSNEGASAAADAACALCNTGYLRIYSGTKPANADAAITGTLLAELTFGATAFAGASNGVATANAIGADTAADATGTATHFRAWKSNGTSPVFDGTVGTSGADLNLNSVAIQSGAQVSVTSLTYTQSKS